MKRKFAFLIRAHYLLTLRLNFQYSIASLDKRILFECFTAWENIVSSRHRYGYKGWIQLGGFVWIIFFPAFGTCCWIYAMHSSGHYRTGLIDWTVGTFVVATFIMAILTLLLFIVFLFTTVLKMENEKCINADGFTVSNQSLPNVENRSEGGKDLLN